ncbi:hypothetical protein SLEP1_g48927 [Rubroshorea leprosula]|uniref:Reverse transcriptase domain-containing protein n=1 Tax=Rubroshorea leprosula TaxID=152421 RepID=A0AAV5LWA7_9ROSI|nr:hypothetical protein SLEP1_g48927 [Rubroshorea leprosula]
MRGRERAGVLSNGPYGRRSARRWEPFGNQRWIRDGRKVGSPARGLRKKQDIWGCDRGVYNQAAVFFFTNFPDDWSYESMWLTFRKFGRVLAIYCPPRKSKSGRRFGFVRFLEVKNEVELERKLDQIRVGTTKLWVNRPRFRMEEGRNRGDSKPAERNFVKPGRSFAEVVKGIQGVDDNKGSNLQQASSARDSQKMQQKSNSLKPQTQVWIMKNNVRASAGLEFNVKKEDLLWLEGCYVGIAHSVNIIPTLQQKFFMEGYFSCKVRPMGGRLVLLEGGDKDEIKDLVETTPEWLGQWFEEVKPWSPSSVAQERFVWIRCQGVPIHAWGPEFFSSIRAVWGKVISLDDSTSKKIRFDIGRFLISTPIMEFISKTMPITVNGMPYTVKVMEEEATNGIFSMKSDHVFRELSASDDLSSESWSLNSDGEDVFAESIHGGGFSKEYGRSAAGRVEDDDMAKADDVIDDHGRGQAERWRESLNVDITARRKNFEFEDDIDRMMSVDGSNIQAEKFFEVSVGKSQKSPISKPEEMTEEVGYVPDSLSMQLMQNQGQNSNCEIGDSIGPKHLKRAIEENWGKACGLEPRAGMGDDEDWASYLGPNKGNKPYVAGDDVEISEMEKDKIEEDKVKRRSRGSLMAEVEEVNRRSKGSWVPEDDVVKLTSRGSVVHVEVEANRRNWESLINEEDEESRSCRGSRRPEEEEANRTSMGSVMHVERESKSGPGGSVMSEKGEGNLRSRGMVMSEEEEVHSVNQRRKGSWSRQEDFGEENSFWQGFESESGQLKTWMGRNERKIKKPKKKKSRPCSSVYKNSRIVVQPRTEKLQNRRKKNPDLEEKTPVFCPGSQNQVAGESIADSGIENRNKCLRAEGKISKEMKIWGFAREIGVVDRGNEEEILQRLEAMEERDRENFRRSKASVGGHGKRAGVRELVIPEKVEFLSIQESKTEVVDHQLCRALWGSEEFEWVAQPSKVRNDQERKGGMSLRREMPEFNDFINECGLVDLPLIGRKFTWYQPNGASMSRLDRFLLSEEWCLNWDNVKQWGLNRSLSDHCPIVLKNQISDWGPKPFRFFDAWLEFPQFKGIVTDIWKSTVVKGWNGYRLKEKLKETKKVLKEWSKNMTTEIDLGIQKSIDSIASIDKKGEEMPLSLEEIEARRTNFLELWKNQRMKESMWRQKARKTWINDGDANTKFFHRCVKGRRRKNDISSILVGNQRLEDVNSMKDGVANYFETLFKEDVWQRPVLDGVDFKKISHEEKAMLEAPFSEEEVRQAVWSCESTKAPGPDGFNFKFVKEMWGTLKDDVMGYISDFHKHGKLVRGMNCSFIALIPKVNSPQKIEEFRPISLVGVMYKLIAKLLARRLASVLNGIIGENQMAFVSGRQLVDSVIIANEIIDEAQKRKKKGFVFKADFEKAYDKVCWEFLDYMMLRMGFGQKWKNWIIECLKTAEVSVLLNGSTTRQFKMQRGLRQGDPLSPFLFLIVAEGLNGIISSTVSLGMISGIEIGQCGMSVTHLQFADDTIVFGNASEENIWAVKSIMRIFEMVSGLKINFGKSMLMGINVPEEWMTRMSCILNCKQGSFPCKYLGMPIGGRRRCIAMWSPMIDSFKKKLASWKNRFISLGGRITLLNSVLSSLPVFMMSVHLLPKGLILILDKIRRNFLWGGGENNKKINWVCWEKVCRSKLDGGLGVKDLRKFNLALLGKWWSRLAEGEEDLLYKVIREKYGSNGGNWLNWIEEGKQKGSLWWRDVCRLDYSCSNRVGWLLDGFKLKLGEGISVKFWEDVWIEDKTLANKFPRLFLNSLGRTKSISQMGFWSNGSWNWSLEWRRPIFSWEEHSMAELWRMLQNIQPNKGQKDRWEWRNDQGMYSAKSGYQVLSNIHHQSRNNLHKRTWCRLVPTKICAFVWKVLQDRIPSKCGPNASNGGEHRLLELTIAMHSLNNKQPPLKMQTSGQDGMQSGVQQSGPYGVLEMKGLSETMTKMSIGSLSWCNCEHSNG